MELALAQHDETGYNLQEAETTIGLEHGEAPSDLRRREPRRATLTIGKIP